MLLFNCSASHQKKYSSYQGPWSFSDFPNSFKAHLYWGSLCCFQAYVFPSRQTNCFTSIRKDTQTCPLKPMFYTRCGNKLLYWLQEVQSRLELTSSLWTLPSCSRKPALFGHVVSDLREAWQSVSTISRFELGWHKHSPDATKTIQTFRE